MKNNIHVIFGHIVTCAIIMAKTVNTKNRSRPRRWFIYKEWASFDFQVYNYTGLTTHWVLVEQDSCMVWWQNDKQLLQPQNVQMFLACKYTCPPFCYSANLVCYPVPSIRTKYDSSLWTKLTSIQLLQKMCN